MAAVGTFVDLNNFGVDGSSLDALDSLARLNRLDNLARLDGLDNLNNLRGPSFRFLVMIAITGSAERQEVAALALLCAMMAGFLLAMMAGFLLARTAGGMLARMAGMLGGSLSVERACAAVNIELRGGSAGDAAVTAGSSGNAKLRDGSVLGPAVRA